MSGKAYLLFGHRTAVNRRERACWSSRAYGAASARAITGHFFAHFAGVGGRHQRPAGAREAPIVGRRFARVGVAACCADGGTSSNIGENAQLLPVAALPAPLVWCSGEGIGGVPQAAAGQHSASSKRRADVIAARRAREEIDFAELRAGE